MKNRIRWVLAALLLMGVVWASAATLGYDFSFGSGSAGTSGGSFQASDRPATAAPAIRSGLIESFDVVRVRVLAIGPGISIETSLTVQCDLGILPKETFQDGGDSR